MTSGDGQTAICPNCGETLYLFGEEDVGICPECGNTVSQFEGGTIDCNDSQGYERTDRKSVFSEDK